MTKFNIRFILITPNYNDFNIKKFEGFVGFYDMIKLIKSQDLKDFKIIINEPGYGLKDIKIEEILKLFED